MDGSSTTPPSTDIKPPAALSGEQSQLNQVSSTGNINNQPSAVPTSINRPKTRVNSGSSTGTSHLSNLTTTSVYFPSNSQYFNVPTRVSSAGSQRTTANANQLSGNGSRVAMTTNLALYTYLLQANRSLAKEMRASVVRSQNKESDNNPSDTNIKTEDANNNRSNKSNSLPVAFPG